MITATSTVKELGEYLARHNLTLAVEHATALWAVFLYYGEVQFVGSSTRFAEAVALAVAQHARSLTP